MIDVDTATFGLVFGLVAGVLDLLGCPIAEGGVGGGVGWLVSGRLEKCRYTLVREKDVGSMYCTLQYTLYHSTIHAMMRYMSAWVAAISR